LKALVRWDGGEAATDLSQPIDIAITLDFSTEQPRHFDAPAANTQPFAVAGFSGSVARGASCNCNIITLIPHCNGTHTECVGHLTAERLDAHRQVPAGLIPALLITVDPIDATATGENTEPRPKADDKLVTRATLENAWRPALTNTERPTTAGTGPAALASAWPAAFDVGSPESGSAPVPPTFRPRALIIRTLPNDSSKLHRDYTNITPPYLTREAAQFLVEQSIEHLLVDLPSIDRAHDEGRLTAHRVFFGLPAGSTSLAAATRTRATVTELTFIPNEVADGPYLLQIQVPAIGGDAVPSRPLLYKFETP
jgi:Putative cyclase